MARVVSDEVLNQLHEGRALAARVRPERPGWSAWVWVCPIMRGGRTLAQARQEWTRERVASSYDGEIEQFRLRRVELSEWHLDDARFFDMDTAIRERPITDLQLSVNSEAALEEWLTGNGVVPGSLIDPLAADYPDPPAMRLRDGDG